MNSKRTFSWIMNIVAITGASLVFATLASAQDFQGKFILSQPAQWGRVMLQPGSYRLRLTPEPGGKDLVTVLSESKGGPEFMIMPQGLNLSDTAEKSSLVCIRTAGGLRVRSLEVGPLGETIYFRQPKGVTIHAQMHNSDSPTLLAQAPELIERVPLTLFGK